MYYHKASITRNGMEINVISKKLRCTGRNEKGKSIRYF